MLIWKVIAANPGISRQQIWERVEHDIPAGYARRLHERCEKPTAQPDAVGLSRARGFVLTTTLTHLRSNGSVAWQGEGKDRRYTVARELTYRGNPDAIDETGTKAAEHMAVADALRITEKLLARRRPGNRPYVSLSRRECDAVALLAGAIRAKGSAYMAP